MVKGGNKGGEILQRPDLHLLVIVGLLKLIQIQDLVGGEASSQLKD
jgi:hypothetical protein